MAELFWNAGRNDRKTGLDALGLRGLDQDLERLWAAGITTISFRARYLSLLPWVCAEFFQRQLDAGSDAEFHIEQFDAVLRRLEAIVFFSTRIGKSDGETGPATGVMGRELFLEEAERLDAGGMVEIPVSKGGGLLGTYFMPCRSFGLVDWPLRGSPLPLRIPPRGQALWQARRKALSTSALANIVFDGGPVSKSDLLDEGQYFSVNRIDSIPEELDLLRSAFLVPSPGVDTETFARFQRTIEWSLTALAGAGEMTPAEMIRQAFARVVRNAAVETTDVERAWCEYELYRRTHFACEILLYAVVGTLNGESRSIASLLDEWYSVRELPIYLEQAFGWRDWPQGLMRETTTRAVAYLDEILPIVQIRQSPPAVAAAFGVALLLTCVEQGRPLQESATLTVHDSPFKRLCELVHTHQDASVREFLRALVTTAIVAQHVNNALRKMAAGGPCTLRFFWDGEVLCPTGTIMNPGFSGDRLTNVVGMLADLGYADRLSGARFRPSALGQALLQERQVQA